MGIPKFFRYMSERYPCLNELVKEFQLPDFDNLYLDMNGIIHACSHPNDFNASFAITEEEIFANIFHYVEVLFNMIKPRKLFFMAVDGVAPRAKINQQRARRFRSAKETEINLEKALKENKNLMINERFDSNCITPGTVFMDNLHSQLKYFVTKKISTDPSWQNCKVILSGHKTPGEGEHKIMDYIRYLKTLPDYDENTKHCLYGLDADLIMLGLCSHEPYFTLLREKVLFKSQQGQTIKSPDEIEFYLLHLSLLRDYLDLEFQELKGTLPFGYNLENIIDDWVLMGFLVGNDFIPHLPDLHINKGALPIMYKAYKDVLPSLDGYLNENGYLSLPRFQKFMERLSKHDLDTFEDTYANLNFLEEKTGKKTVSEESGFGVVVKCLDLQSIGSEFKSFFKKKNSKATPLYVADHHCKTQKFNEKVKRNSDLEALIKSTEELLDLSDEEGLLDENDDLDDNDIFLWEFYQHKKNYYTSKLDYSNVTPEVLQSQSEGYIRAIQWNLHYYYQGCQSWSWYYPHHYSPYISDITNFKDLKLDFEMGRPFLPFEQLLAVLPAASKNLLPAAYQDLMTSPNSPIKDFYPTDFETDLNGKDHEWEAVVLIPFIDEKRLLEAMKTCNDKLTPEERERNQHGPMHVYTFTDKDLGPYKSTKYFPTIISNYASVKDVYREEIEVEISQLKYGLRPGVLLDVFYPGFPILKHIPFEAALKLGNVTVFFSQNKIWSMILTLTKRQFPSLEDLAKDLLGKTAYVQWPYLIEARIVALSDGKTKFNLSENETVNAESVGENFRLLWKKESAEIKVSYHMKLGIEIGDVDIIAYVQRLEGMKYVCGPTGQITLEKQWNEHLTPHAIQTIVKDIPIHSGAKTRSSHLDIMDAFPVNSVVFMLGQPHFGSKGRVLDSSECWKNGRLSVALEIVSDPIISKSLLKTQTKTVYMPNRLAALKIGIHPRLLSRIAGCVYVSMTKGPESKKSNINIGLNLKFFKKNEEIPGYSKKEKDEWLFSQKAIDVISQYVEKFSRVVEYLSDHWDFSIFVQDIFPGNEGLEEMKNMVQWIKNQEFNKVGKVKCGTDIIESELVSKIEEIVNNFQNKSFTRTIQIKPHLLYKSDQVFGNIPPVKSAKHCLLDRIVSIRSSYTVPSGLRGFIIGIHPAPLPADYIYDVLFDKPFVGASKGISSAEKIFSMSWGSFINISDAKRKSETKTPKKTNILTDPFAPPILKPTKKWNNSKNSAFVQWFNPPVQTPRPEVNEEFQKMWLSLQKPQEEPTSTLKKILKIQEEQNVPPPQNKIEDPVKSFFEKVTKVSTDTPSTPPTVVPLIYEKNIQNKNKYSNQLFSYCQKRNLGQPRFKYLKMGSKVVAQVKLSNGRMYSGVPCDDKQSACESAALQAWGALKEVSSNSKLFSQKESNNRPISCQPSVTNTLKVNQTESHKKILMKPQHVGLPPPPPCLVPPILPTPPSQWVGLSGHQGKNQSLPRDKKSTAPLHKTQNNSNPNQQPNRRHQSSALEFVPLQAIAGKLCFNNRTAFQASTQGSNATQKRPQEAKKPQLAPTNSLCNWAPPSSTQPKRKIKIAANLDLDPNLC